MATNFTQEDVNVRIQVNLSAIITLGVYAGPITKAMIAENLQSYINALTTTDLEDLIDKVSIVDIHLDDGTTLIAAE